MKGQSAPDHVGLTDHLEAGLRIDQLREAPTDDLVIIDEEHPDHRVAPDAGAEERPSISASPGS